MFEIRMGVDFEKCDECCHSYPDCGDNYPRTVTIDTIVITICPDCFTKRDPKPMPFISCAYILFKFVHRDKSVIYQKDEEANLETWTALSDMVYAKRVVKIACVVVEKDKDPNTHGRDHDDGDDGDGDGDNDDDEKKGTNITTLENGVNKDDNDDDDNDDNDGDDQPTLSAAKFDEAFNAAAANEKVVLIGAKHFVRVNYPKVVRAAMVKFSEPSECDEYCTAPPTPQRKERIKIARCAELRKQLDENATELAQLEQHDVLCFAASELSEHGIALTTVFLIISYLNANASSHMDREQRTSSSSSLSTSSSSLPLLVLPVANRLLLFDLQNAHRKRRFATSMTVVRTHKRQRGTDEEEDGVCLVHVPGAAATAAAIAAAVA